MILLVVGGIVTGVLLGVAVEVLVVGRVRRLHRLHVRIDAAGAGLDAALRRRAAVATRLGLDGPRVDGWGPRREVAENALGRRLAALDRAALPAPARTELAEVERLVVLGRRVHNDAVRAALDLRSRRTVRFLRLHGTAPLPGYVEIADPDAVIPAAVIPAAVIPAAVITAATSNGAGRADVASVDPRSPAL